MALTVPVSHWKNPERQDMPFTPFIPRVLPVTGRCKVSIGVLFVNSNPVLSSLHFDFPIGKKPGRQDEPSTPLFIRALPEYGHCKVSVVVLFINTSAVLSVSQCLHLDFLNGEIPKAVPSTQWWGELLLRESSVFSCY